MKKILIIILVLLVYLFARGEVVGKIENLSKEHSLQLIKDRLIISDAQRMSLRVYSLKTLELVATFGSKGEGPGEFRLPPFVSIKDNFYYAFGLGKVSVFSDTGKLTRELPLPSKIRRTRWFGDLYLGTETQNRADRNGKLYGWAWGLYDPRNPGLAIKQFYSEWYPLANFRNQVKRIITLPIQPDIQLQVYKNMLIFGDPGPSSHFSIFNEKADKIGEFSYPDPKIKIDREGKRRLRNYFEENFQHSETFKVKFMSHYPPFKYFLVNNHQIYVFSYRCKKEKSEMVAFDFKGKKLFKTFLPDARGVIHHQYFFYLTDNTEKEYWALNRVRIGEIREYEPGKNVKGD